MPVHFTRSFFVRPIVFAAALLALTSAAPAWAQVDFSGEWAPRFWEDQPERVAGPMLGDYLGIPITDAARKYCVPDGIPRVLANPYPFEIIQAPPGQITMVYELNHQIRTVAMDKPTPTYEDLIAFPFYNGHSYGHFEGDTLVVETRGFNEKTFLDATGAPHTDMLLTTERIRKISANQLEDIVTIHDPDYYTRDFQVRFTYNLRNNIRLEDYVCGEKHRDISNIPGVRRP